jgi:hypothetical protein
MNSDKWEMAKKHGINLASCHHFGEDAGGFLCGAMATWHLPMPGRLPDMPLCDKHRDLYEEISIDEILEIIEEFIFEQQNLEEDIDELE